MPDIKEQKLIYHLTSLENMPGILEHGLLPRAHLQDFEDVADQEIIEGRSEHGLENYVPFHWFARNPFDGRVQADRPDEDFALITVRRIKAQRENWKVIPRHPLANAAPQLLDFQPGFDTIDWETMNNRDYHDPECKSICMAECLSPGPVPVSKFFKIYAPNDAVAEAIEEMIDDMDLELEVDVNPGMFL
ncbi:DarT ssDNA thymidine ADP-ribosyltransferase family protein [Massilia sp. NR 4-1]|uniref:DarT ssDNA thymidine ADP-ribosyltransferase family protein n=1 Tax=Massilia sp. NR 4-1 TaxID=1678028 RepID=UPI0009E5EAF3|nr:DarT ssDNA thymidine ADP-ribosyltransferase family protein [Massilia sp. NR 4-1]